MSQEWNIMGRGRESVNSLVSLLSQFIFKSKTNLVLFKYTILFSINFSSNWLNGHRLHLFGSRVTIYLFKFVIIYWAASFTHLTIKHIPLFAILLFFLQYNQMCLACGIFNCQYNCSPENYTI